MTTAQHSKAILFFLQSGTKCPVKASVLFQIFREVRMVCTGRSQYSCHAPSLAQSPHLLGLLLWGPRVPLVLLLTGGWGTPCKTFQNRLVLGLHESPQNSSVEILMPEVMGSGGEAFVGVMRWWGQSRHEINVLIKEAPARPLSPFCLVRTEGEVCKLGVALIHPLLARQPQTASLQGCEKHISVVKNPVHGIFVVTAWDRTWSSRQTEFFLQSLSLQALNGESPLTFSLPREPQSGFFMKTLACGGGGNRGKMRERSPASLTLNFSHLTSTWTQARMSAIPGVHVLFL